MLSDALKEYDSCPDEPTLKILAYGMLSSQHAGMFVAYIKQMKNRYMLSDIIKGDARWPSKAEERDVLYFLAQSFRALLLHNLPRSRQKLNRENQYLVHRAKTLMKELARINQEIAQMVVASDQGETLPDWFLVEIIRDLPRLVS